MVKTISCPCGFLDTLMKCYSHIKPSLIEHQLHPYALKQNAPSNNQDYEGGYSHVTVGFFNDETSPPFSEFCIFSHFIFSVIIQKYLTSLDICFLPKSGQKKW